MDDVILSGKITDINQLIPKIQWKESEALMILERFQNQWLEPVERENIVRFEAFQSSENFNLFQTGRIFDSEKELLWKWNYPDHFHIIYSGVSADLPELQPESTSHLEISEQKYLLWGRKHETQPVFLELQIPRLLRYPLECKTDKARLAIKVVEYRDQSTLSCHHYRYAGLEEAL